MKEQGDTPFCPALHGEEQMVYALHHLIFSTIFCLIYYSFLYLFIIRILFTPLHTGRGKGVGLFISD